MTNNDIKLRAAEFYSKLNLDKYNLSPEQRADAEEMAKALSLVSAQFICGLKSHKEAPAGIDERDWNDLYSLLQVANGILNEEEKKAFIKTVKDIIATGDPRNIKYDILHNLQSIIRSHFARASHKNNINAFEVVEDFVPDETTLSPEEHQLLYKINKQPFPGTYLPGYFSYEYQMDFSYTLNKLIYLGYLELVPQSQFMSKLTCADLRSILDRYRLPTKGKKDDLIDRVYANISPDEIDKLYPTKYFVTTDKWKRSGEYARLQG